MNTQTLDRLADTILKEKGWLTKLVNGTILYVKDGHELPIRDAAMHEALSVCWHKKDLG